MLLMDDLKSWHGLSEFIFKRTKFDLNILGASCARSRSEHTRCLMRVCRLCSLGRLRLLCHRERPPGSPRAAAGWVAAGAALSTPEVSWSCRVLGGWFGFPRGAQVLCSRVSTNSPTAWGVRWGGRGGWRDAVGCWAGSCPPSPVPSSAPAVCAGDQAQAGEPAQS